MKYLVTWAYCMFFALPAFTQKEKPKPYAITKLGDTVWLTNESFIQFENHPQTIYTKGSDGKKKIIAASEIALLKMDGGKAGFYAIKGFQQLTVAPIATKKRTSCLHFMYQMARQDSVGIFLTPYCSKCSSLKIYYQKDGGLAYAITKKNFAIVCGRYFNDNPEMVTFSKRKRYNANQLLKLLQSFRWNALGATL